MAELERDAYLVLDELTKNVSTKNLEHVRSLKSNLTRLLARVQKAFLISVVSFSILINAHKENTPYLDLECAHECMCVKEGGAIT